MTIQIIAIGKIKEKFIKQGIDEYLKRLKTYAKVEIIELSDEQMADNSSPALEEDVRLKEADRIIKRLKDKTYLIALDLAGEEISSQGLAAKIDSLALNGKSHISFVIGGSIGLHQSLLSRADRRLSFSKLTFPHQLFRLILIEQIYRCFKIINNEPYHK